MPLRMPDIPHWLMIPNSQLTIMMAAGPTWRMPLDATTSLSALFEAGNKQTQISLERRERSA
jgi:hypothetical protein